MNEPVFRTEDPWKLLRNYTDARIALGRVGASLPTAAVLAFSLAHARARDAVLSELDADAVERSLGVLGLGIVRATSRCRDKGEYLRRPDLGRRLSDSSRRELEALAPERGCELAIVVADGLSSAAIECQILPFLSLFLPLVSDLSIAPLCLATYGRVALSDEVGALLGAKAAVILIGERPGLSSPDSLGAYLTYAPSIGTTDERRNCISNIRPSGLAFDRAASKLDYLLRESLRRRISGVDLKDEQGSLADMEARAAAPVLT